MMWGELVHQPCSSAGHRIMMPCLCFGGWDHLIPPFSHFSGMKSYGDDDDEEEEQLPLVQPL